MSAYAPGAPAIVWAVAGVSDGAKLLLLHWWSKADHETQRSPRPCTVWAPAAEHEDGTRMSPSQSLLEDARTVHPGKAERTIRGYFRELRAAGLADVDGRCVDLTPPDPATPRQDPATDRQKSAGKNLPRPGEILPTSGENPPRSGKNQPSQLYPPVPQDPPTVSPATSAPEVEPDSLDELTAEHGDLLVECPDCDLETKHVTLGADRVQCSACGLVGPNPDRPGRAFDPERIADAREQLERNGVRMLAPHEPKPDDEPSPPPTATLAAVPTPAKPRRTRKAAPPRTGQAALELGTEPAARDVVAELLELHGRLRAEAQRHHGERVTKLARAPSKAHAAIVAGARQAVRERGEQWCLEMIAWRGRQWLDDASQLAWSTSSVWTGPSLKQADKRMSGTARSVPARKGMLLSAPPAGKAPAYTPSEDDDSWKM